MQHQKGFRSGIRFAVLGAALSLITACSSPLRDVPTIASVELDPNRQAMALREVKVLQSKGHRVWCVPYARNVSGVEIRGNAYTWWAKAKGLYDRGNEPAIGAVMVFSKTRRNHNGHLAVVSKIVSDREILIDHANWKRNRVSQNMSVIDVSDAGDWSRVKVESNPGSYGRVYPISGFIYPASSSSI